MTGKEFQKKHHEATMKAGYLEVCINTLVRLGEDYVTSDAIAILEEKKFQIETTLNYYDNLKIQD